MKIDNIIDQSKLNKYKYGNYTSDYNGCGWIAVYNSFKALNMEKSPAEIINYFEKKRSNIRRDIWNIPYKHKKNI